MARSKAFDEDDVLNKAIDLFWEKGYHATSMQDLVDRLGINRASLYDTFGGKEELFLKAFERYRRRSFDSMRKFLEQQPSVKEGLSKLFGMAAMKALEEGNPKGCFVVNVTTEMLPTQKSYRKALAENKAAFEDLFVHHLKRGVKTGEISKKTDLRATASFLFTLYNGLMVTAKINKEPGPMLAAIQAGLSAVQ